MLLISNPLVLHCFSLSRSVVLTWKVRTTFKKDGLTNKNDPSCSQIYRSWWEMSCPQHLTSTHTLSTPEVVVPQPPTKKARPKNWRELATIEEIQTLFSRLHASIEAQGANEGIGKDDIGEDGMEGYLDLPKEN
ncbi:hypothetical protein AMTR_s00138p00111510 [Amborella trichopoda]|uniref:Uncharacterized protein n=1 Tax=Amborella trichopoda TaxID=13333 RepID=W1NFB6_AMBTC|nr:hypothetical protein AMTR_s00138p00111510 [Amborella trichopoda]